MIHVAEQKRVFTFISLYPLGLVASINTTLVIIIRYRHVVRPHRLSYILKVYLSIRHLHLRGRDTQAGSMRTSKPDIQKMGPPSKIGNNVTDHSCEYFELHLDPVCQHGDTLQPWS